MIKRDSSNNRLLNSIGEYLIELQQSADETTYANDRMTYTKHLAEAARWIAMIYRKDSDAKVKKAILDEQRAYGWGYLSGEPGKQAEKAFAKLIDSIK